MLKPIKKEEVSVTSSTILHIHASDTEDAAAERSTKLSGFCKYRYTRNYYSLGKSSCTLLTHYVFHVI